MHDLFCGIRATWTSGFTLIAAVVELSPHHVDSAMILGKLPSLSGLVCLAQEMLEIEAPEEH